MEENKVLNTEGARLYVKKTHKDLKETKAKQNDYEIVNYVDTDNVSFAKMKIKNGKLVYFNCCNENGDFCNFRQIYDEEKKVTYSINYNEKGKISELNVLKDAKKEKNSHLPSIARGKHNSRYR